MSPFNRSLPLVIQSGRDAIDMGSSYATQSWVTERLLEHGAVLFRGLSVQSVHEFNAFAEWTIGAPLRYDEASSPRTHVEDNVYTSTDYPRQYSIFLHNELSYASRWPMKLAFFCETPAPVGGETPIADTRAITRSIDRGVRSRFAEKDVLYMRNLGGGLGLHWTTVFSTSDRSEVEQRCRDAKIRFEWKGDVLRTWQIRPALRRHPLTGEDLWFNHATFFHVTTLEPDIREVLITSLGPDGVPNNTFYGDGTSIEDDVLDHLRSVYLGHMRMFQWHKGDIMLLDNMLVSHGRAAYDGARKILVAMAEPVGDRMTAAPDVMSP